MLSAGCASTLYSAMLFFPERLRELPKGDEERKDERSEDPNGELDFLSPNGEDLLSPKAGFLSLRTSFKFSFAFSADFESSFESSCADFLLSKGEGLRVLLFKP